MSSLLSPFSFGHRTAYFAVDVTLHELQDVPLLSGRFQAKWKVRRSHHYSPHLSYPGGSNSTSATHHDPHGAKPLHTDANEDGQHEDTKSHSTPKDDASSSIYSGGGDDDDDDDDDDHLAPPSGHNFLSNFFHRRQRKESHQFRGFHNTAAPSQRSSFDSERIETTQNSSTISRSTDLSQSRQQSDHTNSLHLATPFHAEPRGSSEWVEVTDHRVQWERAFHSGIRVGVDKAKPGAQHAPPSSTDSAYDAKVLRGRTSHLDLRLQEEKEREEQAAWGLLGSSELKITIRQDVQTDSHGSGGSAALGVVVLNLAEYAPCPQTATHSHHQHQHHSHHHPSYNNHHPHHPHHHHYQQQPRHSATGTSAGSGPSANASQPPLPLLQRRETRRYLLQESKTNASLQISIKVTHIGGLREYTVPPIRRGLVIGGLRAVSDHPIGHSHPDGCDSERSSVHESRPLHHEPSSASIRHFSTRQQKKPSTLDKFAASNNSTRIPSKNLKGGDGSKKGGWFSHHSSTASPVSSWNAQSVSGKGSKRTQLQSLAFAFSGAGNWERDPSDVINALFAATANSATVRDRTKTGHEAKAIKSREDTLRPAPVQKSASQRSIQSTSSQGKEKGGLLTRRQSGCSAIRPLSLESSRTDSPSASFAHLSPVKNRMTSTASSVTTSNSIPRIPPPTSDLTSSSVLATPDRSHTRIKWSIGGGEGDTNSGPAPSSVPSSPVPMRKASDDTLAGQMVLQRSVSASASASTSTSTNSSPVQRRSALIRDSASPSVSPSKSSIMSPSASTVMEEEVTPMPSRVTSVTLSRHLQGAKKGHGSDDGRSEKSVTVIGQEEGPGRIRKKKSKGLIGIRPSEAQKLGLKGAGWKSSGIRSRSSLRSSMALYERDESPKGTRGDFESTADRVQEFGLSRPKEEQDSEEKGAEEDGEADASVLALTPLLFPYVKARLGRPRSKVGLRSTSIGSTPKAFTGSSVETVSASTTGGPGPSVTQGHEPLPSHMSRESSERNVPALIPGVAPTKFVPEPDEGQQGASGSSSRGSGGGAGGTATSDQSEEDTSATGKPGGATSSSAIQVWADAQTELEAHFDSRRIYSLLSPPPLPSRRSYLENEDPCTNPPSSLYSGVAVGRGRERGLSLVSRASSARSTLLDRPEGVPAPAAYVIRQMEEEQYRVSQEVQSHGKKKRKKDKGSKPKGV